MFRRSTTLILGVALAVTVTGCRSSCNNGGHGWFSSNSRGSPPGHLTSNGKAMEGCFDPATGQPVPCPPMDAGTVIPGGAVLPGGSFPTIPGTTPRPDELPYP